MVLKIENVPDDLFRQVKAQAVLEDMTLRQYVVDALTAALARSTRKAGTK